MACSEIHRQLLSPDGMKRIRDALIKEYDFFVHCAPQDIVSSILRHGLQPYFPGADTYADMECVYNTLGMRMPPIICFTTPNHRIKSGVEFAIASRDLPDRIGIDWSFGTYWSYVDMEYQGNPNKSIEQIFLRVLREFHSFVAYDPTPADVLRINIESIPSDPCSWPLLRSLTDDDLQTKLRLIT